MSKALVLLIAALSVVHTIYAQRRGKPVKKDSLVLVCPLEAATYHAPEKGAYDMGVDEPHVIISSDTDTLVKASFSGKVTTIQRSDEGLWELVFHHDDYWFWYTGLEKVKAIKNQTFKAGDVIGIVKPGAKMELRIYDFETPLDPKNYLPCKKE